MGHGKRSRAADMSGRPSERPEQERPSAPQPEANTANITEQQQDSESEVSVANSSGQERDSSESGANLAQQESELSESDPYTSKKHSGSLERASHSEAQAPDFVERGSHSTVKDPDSGEQGPHSEVLADIAESVLQAHTNSIISSQKGLLDAQSAVANAQHAEVIRQLDSVCELLQNASKVAELQVIAQLLPMLGKSAETNQAIEFAISLLPHREVAEGIKLIMQSSSFTQADASAADNSAVSQIELELRAVAAQQRLLDEGSQSEPGPYEQVRQARSPEGAARHDALLESNEEAEAEYKRILDELEQKRMDAELELNRLIEEVELQKGLAASFAQKLVESEQDAQLVATLRKPADEAFGKKKYAEALRLYLAAAEEIGKRKLDHANNRCLMYAGAGAAAYYTKHFVNAIKFLRQSFVFMDSQKSGFLPALSYVCDYLQTLEFYTKGKSRIDLSKLKAEMFKKFSPDLEHFKPPRTTHHGASYKLHGTTLNDAFSSLEDASSETSKAWLKHEKDYSKFCLYLSLLNFRMPPEYYKGSIAQINDLPYQIEDYFYFSGYNPKTYRRFFSRAKKPDGKPKLLLSEELVCPQGSYLADKRASPDGKYVAYGISKNGSDWYQWKVKNTKTGKDVPKLDLCLYGSRLFFHPESKGIVYWDDKKPDGENNQHGRLEMNVDIRYRPLHPRGKRSTLVHTAIDPKSDYLGVVYCLEDKALLISEGTKQERKSRMYLRNLLSKRRQIIELFDGKAAYYEYLGFLNRTLLFWAGMTSSEKRKLFKVELDAEKFSIKSVTKVDLFKNYPNRDDLQVLDLHLLKNQFIANCLSDRGTKSKLLRLSHDGKLLGEIKLPYEGIVSNLNSDFDSNHVFFDLHHFSRPSSIYYHNLRSGKTKLLRAPAKSPGKDLVCKVVEVKSKDGNIVPMWLVHRRSVKPNSNTPTLMSVYGGFDLKMLPMYSSKVLAWTAMGGLWAQPYLRGGGELGQEWHHQACKLNKQKTFDDAIACARFLINNRLSSAKKLAIDGASNGGLTVGAVITQHPELFAAGLASNGLFDMMKFAKHTAGWAWESEYGSVKKKAEFTAIRAYSPYHNVHRKIKTPAMLLCASEQDDRVPPWHSYKFAAMLNESTSSKNPILLRVEANSGHHSMRATNETRDQLAFLKWVLKF